MTVGVMLAVGTVEFETALLERAGSGGFHVVRRCVDVADLLATAATRQAEVALISAQLPGLDADVVARLHEEHVVVVGGVALADGDDTTALARLGVRAVVAAEAIDSFGDVVTAALAPEQGALTVVSSAGDDQAEHSRLHPGKLVAVWGPTGAPGRSVVALGVASELARLKEPTLLIDADVYGGSQAQLLGLLDETSGLLAATRAANLGVLNQQMLAGHARAINSYLRILSGLPNAGRWPEVRPVLLRRVLTVSRSLATYTVVDCGFSLELDEEISYDTAAPRRNGATLTVLEDADLVVVVGGADPVGLARLVRGIHELAAAVPGVSSRVVVNRVRPSLGWSADEIRASLARAARVERVDVLPDDPVACDRAVVQGRTLTECAADSKLARSLRALAAAVTREAPASPPIGHARGP